jgi:hypothetical protein
MRNNYVKLRGREKPQLIDYDDVAEGLRTGEVEAVLDPETDEEIDFETGEKVNRSASSTEDGKSSEEADDQTKSQGALYEEG